MKIKDLKLGDYVDNGDGTYSEVKECIHGKKYYAYQGHIDDEVLLTVSDIDVNYIPCCG